MGEIAFHDPNSFSNPEDCIVNDIKLNLEVNFKKKILEGYVDIAVERKNAKADLFLDTKELVISNIRNKSTMKKINYIQEETHPFRGSKLEIKLPKTSTKRFNIRIDYATSPKANGLTWLEPQQTSGKKHPYLFSSSEPINARSIFPCQDTPGVKAPYSANIIAPFDLVVLMSAVRDGEEMDSDPLMKNFKFVQKIPIPSYLIAIAVGDLESRSIGPRSHVWSEKEYVDLAAEEFSEIESMLCVAEELIGPYIWEVYDLLVLPPSFAWGGMENPCLTFVTPTLLAGDKSLVDVICHEIAHSWTGNLVTNRSHEHFWLNEGFTMFLERKILGKLYGECTRHFHAIGGWKDLEYAVNEEMSADDPLTSLVPNLLDANPEDAMSFVPYEKGHTLLFYLEEKLGSDAFEKFLKAYIEKYKYQSIETKDWQSYLYEYFPDKKDVLDEVDWKAWFDTPGMPPIKPKYDDSMVEKCSDLSKAWTSASEGSLSHFTSKDLAEMSASQIQEFLALLLQDAALPISKLEKMNEVYGCNKIKNSENRLRWIRIGLKAHWKEIIPEAVKFITEQFRIKFCRPIYKDLFEWEETRELAISTLKSSFHLMSYDLSSVLCKDMKLDMKTI